MKKHNLAAEARAWELHGANEVRRLHWQQLFDVLVARVPETVKQETSKSAAWKIAVAARMLAISNVQNDWLAEQLQMGWGNTHSGVLRATRYRSGNIVR